VTAAPAPLPAFGSFTAPAGWRAIDLLSDLHLSEHTPATFAAFRAHLLHTPADAVLLLGDIFEVWIGDDARDTGFAAEVCAVLAQAARRRTVAFMRGNRDFLVGATMLAANGVGELADPTVATAFGERLLLTHGDALCLADADYQRFRSEVRSSAWQQAFLARPLAERRALAADMRAESDRRKRGQAPADWADVDTAAAVRWMHATAAPTLVHGHTHRPGTEWLAPGFLRQVLSDWDLDTAAHPRAEVLRWWRGGLLRMAPASRA
jgi:UDP-2,3-diacylglucosamine hydrolase